MRDVLVLGLLLLMTVNAFAEDSGRKIIADNQTFDLKKPDDKNLIDSMDVWATNYFIPEYEDGSGDVLLRDISGKSLGPRLTTREWCHSALEGSVKINFEKGVSKVFNYYGQSHGYDVDCSAYMKTSVGASRFKISKSEFGEGTAMYNLLPFRSLAADTAVFPLGTVLYIPIAKGDTIDIGGGKTITHDGYFFVADKGGSIEGSHIDVFTGIKKKPVFFPWIGHNKSSTFEVFIVKDPKIVAAMKSLHAKKN